MNTNLIIYGVFIFGANFLQTEICAILCTTSHNKRNHFILRLALSTLVGLLLCFPLSMLEIAAENNIVEMFVRVVCFLIVSAASLGVLVLCYDEKITELMFCWCSGVAFQQISTRTYQLIQNFCGINDKLYLSFFKAPPQFYDYIIYFAYYIAAYVLCWLVFRKRSRLELDKQTAKGVAILSAITVLLINGLACIARIYEQESFALNIILKIFCIMTGIIILFICAGMLSQSKTRRDMNVLQHMWRQEKIQFEHTKANIDAINAKCHDLKHVFSRLENKLNQSDLDELKSAVEFYDRNINTGNEILDVIMCDKSMLCSHDDIKLSCLADGKLLNFMTPSQTYSLFGNMLDNAIESVRKIPDKAKRIISLTIRSDGDEIEIECVNYRNPEDMTKADQKTSKEDSNHHGYGITSMRYITEQYGGKMSIEKDDESFLLRIVFPKSLSTEKKLVKE